MSSHWEFIQALSRFLLRTLTPKFIVEKDINGNYWRRATCKQDGVVFLKAAPNCRMYTVGESVKVFEK